MKKVTHIYCTKMFLQEAEHLAERRIPNTSDVEGHAPVVTASMHYMNQCLPNDQL